MSCSRKSQPHKHIAPFEKGSTWLQGLLALPPDDSSQQIDKIEHKYVTKFIYRGKKIEYWKSTCK